MKLYMKIPLLCDKAQCNRYTGSTAVKNLKTRRDEISWHCGLKWAYIIIIIIIIITW